MPLHKRPCHTQNLTSNGHPARVHRDQVRHSVSLPVLSDLRLPRQPRSMSGDAVDPRHAPLRSPCHTPAESPGSPRCAGLPFGPRLPSSPPGRPPATSPRRAVRRPHQAILLSPPSPAQKHRTGRCSAGVRSRWTNGRRIGYRRLPSASRAPGPAFSGPCGSPRAGGRRLRIQPAR